jgi:PAS domain S-box-containing protein
MSNDTDSEDTQALEASRRKFETIFEHANDAIFIVDIANDSVVDCNPAAEELVEYSREELQSMPASDLHPHNLPEFMDFADTVLEQGQGWTDDITCYCKSGDIIPAEMSASVVELDGRPHLVNHVRNTTDREEREWFETLIEHSSDLITVVKYDGTIQYLSPSVDHVLGYTPDELRGEPFLDRVHPDDCPDVSEILERVAYDTENVTQRREYRFRRADGSWAWLESIVSHRPDATITGYVINSRDITLRKGSQQQAAVLHRMLRHNLRNELNVILGHAGELAASADADIASRAETIIDSGSNLRDATSYARVLNDIIESHRIEQTRQDVTTLVDGIVEAYQDGPVTFACDLPDVLHVTATPKLDVALDHVVRNAVEHNDADSPRVEITARPPATDTGYAEVTIADNGPGIPEQERAVLLEGEETPLEHGSGLGLWIVNWIVTRSGGRITFGENEPRGSRVSLALSPAE